MLAYLIIDGLVQERRNSNGVTVLTHSYVMSSLIGWDHAQLETENSPWITGETGLFHKLHPSLNKQLTFENQTLHMCFITKNFIYIH